MARKCLCVYHDMIPALEALSDAEVGRLIKGALRYGATAELPTFSGNERFTWPLFMSQIDKEKIDHEKRSLINRENALKKANRTEPVQIGANRTESETTKERKESTKESKENIIYNTHSIEKRFIPPTREDVENYCRERCNNVDVERFMDYYESIGWKVGRNPMKDWRAAIRTWEKSEKQQQRTRETGTETNNPFLKLILEGKVEDD